jgi:hypothetical protein
VGDPRDALDVDPNQAPHELLVHLVKLVGLWRPNVAAATSSALRSAAQELFLPPVKEDRTEMDVGGRDGEEKISDATLNEVRRRRRQTW